MMAMSQIPPFLPPKSSHKVGTDLPKADMHVHIALALSPEVFLRRIKDGRTGIGPEFLIERDHRYYPTLTDHHETYERMRDVTATQAELAQVTQDYLERIAREGAIYAEISNSFRDPSKFDAQVDALEEGIKWARANTGIEARIVVTGIRNAGAAHAELAAKHLAKYPRQFVTGFGLAGEENLDSFAEYAGALNIAWHEAGLGLTPHVAEQFVHNAIDFLRMIPQEALEVNAKDARRLRVGHGATIHMSSALMQEFAARGICMEVCLSANKRIGLPHATRQHARGQVVTTNAGHTAVLDLEFQEYFHDIKKHPILEFMKRDIPLCLGSDNPLLMNTNIGKEYTLAVRAGIEDKAALLGFTQNAIRFANVDFETRAALMHRLDVYKQALADGIVPLTTPLGYGRAEDKYKMRG
jgi:adenosine deaminase